MVAIETPPIIGRRYALLELLGKGGMGVVYRAYDRLTGQEVALKQVLRTNDPLSTNAPTQDNELRMALAQEFRVLASLRHPNIVSVLDYGFDVARQPYFTMELLTEAADIVESAHDMLLEDQVELLVQTLQALVYLHRRGVLHRDLKPSNVLVQNRIVKVVDFGLALFEGKEDSALGTLPYLPPELLFGEAPDERTDLYAVGLIAHEMMLGNHPFESENRAHLIHNIVNRVPDLSGMDPNLAIIVGRLLMKKPEHRYRRASDVINVLYTSLGMTPPPENRATRESFLQAAGLIGREDEIGLLAQALARTTGGHGEAWLIGGESGVGKTRLLDELRTMSLVRGVLVVRGETVSEGANPYSAWREPLRALALMADADEREAAVLKPILPNIGAIIGMDVPDAPPLDPEAAQTRLFSTIESMLHRLEQPLVIILEDLHFESGESLALVRWVARIAAGLPLLLLCSYREDERPGLPHELPQMQVLRLERLKDEQIGALSQAMLGEVGRDQRLVELLRRETDGNAYFVVEVVRALAEEAGDLERVTEINLHRRVLTGGVRRILQKRLERVPPAAQPLLRLAAVVGQQINEAVLRQIAPDVDFDEWLTLCSDSALSVQDDRWIFAHAKLRELILSEIDADERRHLHRQVAEALIATTHDPGQEAAALTYHWAMAGDPTREGQYAALAGRHAYQNGAWDEAVTLLARAFTLRNAMGLTDLQAAQILRLEGDAHYRQGNLPEARRCLAQAAELLSWSVPAKNSVFLRQLTRQVGHRLRPFTPPRRSEDRNWLLETHRISMLEAEIAFLSNETMTMLVHGVAALNQAESAGISPELAKASANMCYAIGNIGQHVPASIYKRQARRVAEKVGDPSVQDFALRRTSLYDIGLGHWAEAQDALDRSMELADAIGDLQSREESIDFLASLLYYRGDFPRSRELFAQVQRSAMRTNSLLHHSWGLLGQGQNALRMGSLADAAGLLRNSIKVMEENRVNDIVTQIQAYGLLGVVELYRDNKDAAANLARSAVELINASEATGFALLEGYAGAAEVYLTLYEMTPPEAAERRGQLIAPLNDMLGQLQSLAKNIPIAQPRSLLCAGWLAHLEGDHANGDARLRESVRQALRFDMPFEQGFALYHQGRWLAGDDPLRAQHLDQACAIFTRLGASNHLARARTALEHGDTGA
ncbi:MAG: protein kinase [Anaerolineae bacterium]|nr:protein kinase [Anaerolineae bacterium]